MDTLASYHLRCYSYICYNIFFLVVFSSLTNSPFWLFPDKLYYFTLASWFLFNIFEFGRKTLATGEEQDGIDTYSKLFTKKGAIGLTFMMSVFSTSLLYLSIGTEAFAWILIWFGLLVFFGILYLIFDTSSVAKMYRAITSIYIILIYSTVSIFQLQILLV